MTVLVLPAGAAGHPSTLTPVHHSNLTSRSGEQPIPALLDCSSPAPTGRQTVELPFPTAHTSPTAGEQPTPASPIPAPTGHRTVYLPPSQTDQDTLTHLTGLVETLTSQVKTLTSQVSTLTRLFLTVLVLPAGAAGHPSTSTPVHHSNLTSRSGEQPIPALLDCSSPAPTGRQTVELPFPTAHTSPTAGEQPTPASPIPAPTGHRTVYLPPSQTDQDTLTHLTGLVETLTSQVKTLTSQVAKFYPPGPAARMFTNKLAKGLIRSFDYSLSQQTKKNKREDCWEKIIEALWKDRLPSKWCTCG